VLIAVHPHSRPAWVYAVVYVTVVVTVLSGADYFFGFARASGSRGVEPGAPGGVRH
jgi:hypothetical protein